MQISFNISLPILIFLDHPKATGRSKINTARLIIIVAVPVFAAIIMNNSIYIREFKS